MGIFKKIGEDGKLTGKFDDNDFKRAIKAHLKADADAGVRYHIPGGYPTALATAKQLVVLDTDANGNISYSVNGANVNNTAYTSRYSVTTLDNIIGTGGIAGLAGPLNGNAIVTKNFHVNEIFVRINYLGKLTDLSGMIYAHLSPDKEHETDATKWANLQHSSIKRVSEEPFTYRFKFDDSNSSSYTLAAADMSIMFIYISGGPKSAVGAFSFEITTVFEYVPDDLYRYLIPLSDKRLTLEETTKLNQLRRHPKLDHLIHAHRLHERVDEVPNSWFNKFRRGLIDTASFVKGIIDGPAGEAIQNGLSMISPSLGGATRLLSMALNNSWLNSDDKRVPTNFPMDTKVRLNPVRPALKRKKKKQKSKTKAAIKARR